MSRTTPYVILTRIGTISAALVASSIVLFGLALTIGVHCPDCNRIALGSTYSFWSVYFDVKDGMLALGCMGGMAAVIGAQRRGWGLAALVGAFAAIAVTPM